MTFEEAWPLLDDNGVYICEDTSTSMVRMDHCCRAELSAPLPKLARAQPALSLRRLRCEGNVQWLRQRSAC